MREVFLGEYIKQKRLDMGLTQARLCEGICEPMTVSRLENGQQTPTRPVSKALLERLGLPGDRYFALLSDREAKIKALEDEITTDSIRCRRAPKDEQPDIRAHALEQLAELERITESEDRITQQYILGRRAYFGTREKMYSGEEQLDMLMEAIRLTVPRFDPEEINNSLYSLDEVQIINQIAVTYSGMGQRKKAADIYRQLLVYVEKHNQNLSEYGKYFCMIAHNYAIQLGLEKHYADSMELAYKGWDTCVKYGHYQFLPGFLAILAECCYFMGDIENSKRYYSQAYYIYQAVKDHRNLQNIRREMEERLGLQMPL